MSALKNCFQLSGWHHLGVTVKKIIGSPHNSNDKSPDMPIVRLQLSSTLPDNVRCRAIKTTKHRLCERPGEEQLLEDCHKGSVSSTSKKLSSGCWEIQKQPTIMCSDDHIHLLGTRTEHRNTNFLNFHARERFVFVFICNPTSRNQHQPHPTFCDFLRVTSCVCLIERFGSFFGIIHCRF